MNTFAQRKADRSDKTGQPQRRPILPSPGASPAVQRMQQLGQRLNDGDTGRVAQRMGFVAGPGNIPPAVPAVASIVNGPTHAKHVVATGNQPAEANNAYTDMTFVTSDNDLTGPVDADPTLLAVGQQATVSTNVNVYHWTKTALGVGNQSNLTINNQPALCDIRAKRGGDGQIRVNHFQKQ